MPIDDLLPRDLFAGKTVFVTGGGSGINLGIAQHFAALGASVALCGRTRSRLDAAAADLRAQGGRVCPLVADVRDYAALDAALARSEAELGPVDVLVCGAAGNFLVQAEQLSANGFRTVVDIDLNGSFNAARAAFAQLQRTRGCLLFISAGMAYMPHAYQAHVGAAKAGIDMLMKNLAIEWGPHGIRANSLVPGPIEGTEGMRRLADPARTAAIAEAVPLRRLGTVDDVARMAVVLASPLAAYVTGCVVVCDGGQNLVGSALFNQEMAHRLRAPGTGHR